VELAAVAEAHVRARATGDRAAGGDRRARPDRVARRAAEDDRAAVTGLDGVDAADAVDERRDRRERQSEAVAERVRIVAGRIDGAVVADDHAGAGAGSDRVPGSAADGEIR